MKKKVIIILFCVILFAPVVSRADTGWATFKYGWNKFWRDHYNSTRTYLNEMSNGAWDWRNE